MEGLKSCPFCGGEVAIMQVVDDVYYNYWAITRAGVEAKNPCKCRVFMESELFVNCDDVEKEQRRKELIKAWNRRAE
jgi:hypothetical protein